MGITRFWYIGLPRTVQPESILDHSQHDELAASRKVKREHVSAEALFYDKTEMENITSIQYRQDM